MVDPLTIGTTTMGALHVFDQVSNSLRTARDTAKKVGTIAKGGGSLIAVSNATRVEPFMLVDAALTTYENMDVISNSMLSIFSGFWMLAVDTMTNISDVSVAEKLAPLNPSRNPMMESNSYRIASAKHLKGLDNNCFKFGLPKATSHNYSTEAPPERLPNTGTERDAFDSIIERNDLSVGKVLNVTISENGQRATVKVAIRLMATLVPSGLLKDILGTGSVFETDLKERWHAFLAGRLSFWKDLVFCNDLLKKRKQVALKDKTGIFQAILKRGTNNAIAGLITRVPSLATMTNILVIDESTLNDIEPELGGSISKITIRNQLFESSNLMIICVVQRDMNRCTIYYRDISTSTTASIKEMKNSAKGGGGEVAELLKAFVAGNAPVI